MRSGQLRIHTYIHTYIHTTFESGFLGDFQDLENVSEMVAETSETSKDQQSESTTGKENKCACTCNEKCCQ